MVLLSNPEVPYKPVNIKLSLRTQWQFVWLRISLYFMEPEGLLPCYQDLAIGLCIEPGKSSPHLPI